MKKNFETMDTVQLIELQELLTKEIYKRKQEEKAKAKNKIYELLNKIGKICEDNNFNLYCLDSGEPYEITISDIYAD